MNLQGQEGLGKMDLEDLFHEGESVFFSWHRGHSPLSGRGSISLNMNIISQ